MIAVHGHGNSSKNLNTHSIQHHGQAHDCNLDLHNSINTWFQYHDISYPHYAKSMDTIIILSLHGQAYIEGCQISVSPYKSNSTLVTESAYTLRVKSGY